MESSQCEPRVTARQNDLSGLSLSGRRSEGSEGFEEVSLDPKVG